MAHEDKSIAKECMSMGTMKAVQITSRGGDLELVTREIPDPGAGQVRIRVDKMMSAKVRFRAVLTM